MYEKNLANINNEALKRRLSKINTIESRIGISYCITPSKDYVLLKDDIPFDDLSNPRVAVQKMLENNIKHEMKSNDIIITFGIGLGYLLDETFNKYPSKIFVYEPDLNVLHFVLNNIDISEHLASGRIYITNDIDELISKLSSVYITKDRVEIVYLQNYAVVKNKELLMLTQKVYDACKSKMVDINTITKFSKKWLTNTINNLSYMQNSNVYHLSDLENKFIGQTAIVAAAGPSLADNLEKIKANRDKLVIFAVNKSVKYLFDNDITPDFVVCMDAKNMQNTLGELSHRLGNSNCIMDLRTDSDVTKLGFHKFFYNYSNTDFFAKQLSKTNTDMKFYEIGGTASTFAMVSAIKMGFSKVIMAGVDLAFKDNTIYANGEKMTRVSQEEILVNSVKKNLTNIKSVKGTSVCTREDYKAFIGHFESIIKELNYKEIYNLSSFGAYIEGFKNTDFDNIEIFMKANKASLNTIEPKKLVLKAFMEEEFCNINDVINILSKGVFSPALVTAIVKSVFLYQYLQATILNVLQKNFAPELAETFFNDTKNTIKLVVELLQKNKLI